MIHELVEEVSRARSDSLDRDCPRYCACLDRTFESVEAGMSEYIGTVAHLNGNAEIGFVGPVFDHGLAVRNADKRQSFDFPG